MVEININFGLSQKTLLYDMGYSAIPIRKPARRMLNLTFRKRRRKCLRKNSVSNKGIRVKFINRRW